MSRFVITGATGFLGGKLAQRLARSHELALVKRKQTPIPAWGLNHPGLTWFDKEELGNKSPFEQPVEAVIHTATDYGRGNAAPTRVLEANLIFPMLLLEQALNHKVKAFINTDTTLNRMVNPYSLSKKQFLDWLNLFESQLTIANLKLEMLYGPGDHNQNLITTSLDAFMANKPEMDFTPGEQVRDFIFIDDAVDALSKVTEALPTLAKGINEFQVGTGCKTTLKQFLKTAKILSKSKTRLNFGALAYRDQENMCSVADTTALNRLGWQPRTSLEQGLCLTIEHLRAQNAPK